MDCVVVLMDCAVVLMDCVVVLMDCLVVLTDRLTQPWFAVDGTFGMFLGIILHRR